MPNFEKTLKRKIAKTLGPTKLVDDAEGQDDSGRIRVVPCIMTGRVEDCIRSRLEQFDERGMMIFWY